MFSEKTNIKPRIPLQRIAISDALLTHTTIFKAWGLICTLFFSCSIQAQMALWRNVEKDQLAPNIDRQIIPQRERTVRLDTLSLGKLLAKLPPESITASPPLSHILELPMPDGSMQQFAISRSSIMSKALQDQFPLIQTFVGKGIDDPYATLRFDWTPLGFHAMILSSSGTVFIDPFARNQLSVYSSYYKSDFQALNKQMICDFQDLGIKQDVAIGKSSFGDCQLRIYRLALAATAEYTQFHGGTVSNALSAIVTTMNRVNGVYERDLGVRMELVANNNLLIYTDGATDPYSNGNASTMLGENQGNIDAVIGVDNYDIGHVFGTNSGGVAGFGVVCNDNSKARGVTGGSSPVGDPFDIDYVAHEIGHQFGGSHTFNGTASSCGGNGSSSSAFEPGSGSTIMAYAGICGSQNVQSNSDAYFHARSLEQISNFLTSNSCVPLINTQNNAPFIQQSSPDLTIPAQTPFFLEATATDADGDALSWCWEQYDNQSSTQPPSANSTVGPNFRSFEPTTSPRRYFPQLSAILSNVSPNWEVLPEVSRNMRFRLSVRDHALPAGCTDDALVSLQVEGNAGPFVIQYPSAFQGFHGRAYLIKLFSWDVAKTHISPVNSPFVDIILSTDGGNTFDDTLASSGTQYGQLFYPYSQYTYYTGQNYGGGS